MQFTLFGYPKTGKTTLFNLLTGARLEVSAYDTGKRDPNIRTLAVPDTRLDQLAALYPDKEKKPAVIDIVDLAGLAFGEVKDSSYMSHLRRADGLAHVVRAFVDARIPHIRERIEPVSDIRLMEEELILADTVSVETRLEKLNKDLDRMKNPEGEKEKALLEKIRDHLYEGRALRELDLSSGEDRRIRGFAFLSRKPLLHIINLDEKEAASGALEKEFLSAGGPGVSTSTFCGSIEAEILELDESEKTEFMAEFGLSELSAERFLKKAYQLLRVITFYTIGDKEVKAWTIEEGRTALDAAADIHSDIARGFIKAETICCKDLFQLGSLHSAKEQGTLRLEGKDYIVQDGDILYFRFSP